MRVALVFAFAVAFAFTFALALAEPSVVWRSGGSRSLRRCCCVVVAVVVVAVVVVAATWRHTDPEEVPLQSLEMRAKHGGHSLPVPACVLRNRQEVLNKYLRSGYVPF